MACGDPCFRGGLRMTCLNLGNNWSNLFVLRRVSIVFNDWRIYIDDVIRGVGISFTLGLITQCVVIILKISTIKPV